MQAIIGVLHAPKCFVALYSASVHACAASAVVDLSSPDRPIASTRDQITAKRCKQSCRRSHQHLMEPSHHHCTSSGASAEVGTGECSSSGCSCSDKQAVMAYLIKHLEMAASSTWSGGDLAKHIKAVGDVGQALARIAAADLISSVGNFTRIPAIQDKVLGAQLQLYHTALSFGALMSSCHDAAVTACTFLNSAAAFVYRLQDSSRTVGVVLQELAGLQEQALQQQFACSKLHQHMQKLQGQATYQAQQLMEGIQALLNLGAEAKDQSYRSTLLQRLQRLMTRKTHTSYASQAPVVTSTGDSTHYISSSAAYRSTSAASNFGAGDALCYIAAQSCLDTASCQSSGAACAAAVAGQTAAGKGREIRSGAADFPSLLSSCQQLISDCPSVACSVAELQTFWSNQVKALQDCIDSVKITQSLRSANRADMLVLVDAAESRQLLEVCHYTAGQFQCYSAVVDATAGALSC